MRGSGARLGAIGLAIGLIGAFAVARVNAANRVRSLLEYTVYILAPALAPLYLLRRTGRPEAGRLAAVFGVVVTVSTFILGAIAFFLLAE